MDPQAVGGLVREFFAGEGLKRTLSVALILVGGYLIVRLGLLATRRFTKRKIRNRLGDVIEKLVKYGGGIIVLVNAANAAGFDLTAVLGAAGIAGIAIGFAAQTSVSNVISGLFLFSEKAFEVGDVIQVDAVTGTVESVDMFSVKIRTFDNRLVRVPNETMIKSNIVNATHWPTRRLDIALTLPYGGDPLAAERILRAAAAATPLALAEPEPFFLVDQLGPNGVSILFGVWFNKDDFAALKNAILPLILAKLEAAGMRPSAQVLAFAEGPARGGGAIPAKKPAKPAAAAAPKIPAKRPGRARP